MGGGGVPARGGGVPALGVYLPRGCTCQGRGVYLPGMGTYTGTPPCEQNDRQVQKYYLAPNFRLHAVIMIWGNMLHFLFANVQLFSNVEQPE